MMMMYNKSRYTTSTICYFFFLFFLGTIRSFIHAHHFWQHVAFHENMTQWRLKLRFIDEQSSVDWLL